MGPILCVPNLTSALNLSHHAKRSAGSGLNSTKEVSEVRPMWDQVYDRMVRPDAGMLQKVNEFRGDWVRHVGSTM